MQRPLIEDGEDVDEKRIMGIGEFMILFERHSCPSNPAKRGTLCKGQVTNAYSTSYATLVSRLDLPARMLRYP